MRIISFDIGMKNLAMCILEKREEESIHILDWDVLNVVSGTTVATTIEQPTIGCSLCKRKAKYTNSDSTYFSCTAHKKTNGYISASEATKLPKQTKKILQQFCETHSIEYPLNSLNKDELVKQYILPWIEKHVLYDLTSKPTTSTTDVPPYILMGRFLDTHLRERLLSYKDSVYAVIIENQMAERMKMFQGMVAQFCIGFFPREVKIEFISPMNKLKPVTLPPGLQPDTVVCSLSSDGAGAKYRKNKKDGVERCRNWLNIDPESNWKILFDKSNKKDDLADSFLQGVWYCKCARYLS